MVGSRLKVKSINSGHIKREILKHPSTQLATLKTLKRSVVAPRHLEKENEHWQMCMRAEALIRFRVDPELKPHGAI